MLGPSATDEEIHDKLVAIWNMNKDRLGTDTNLIFPGQQLMLPS